MANNAHVLATNYAIKQPKIQKFFEPGALSKIRLVQDTDLPPSGFAAKFLIRECGQGKALHHMYLGLNGEIKFSHHSMQNIQTEAVQVSLALMNVGKAELTAVLKDTCKPCAVAYYAWKTGKMHDLVRYDNRFNFGPPGIMQLIRTTGSDEKIAKHIRERYLKQHLFPEYDRPILAWIKSNHPESVKDVVTLIYERLVGRFAHVRFNMLTCKTSASIKATFDLTTGMPTNALSKVEKSSGYPLSSFNVSQNIQALKQEYSADHLFYKYNLLGNMRLWPDINILTWTIGQELGSRKVIVGDTSVVGAELYTERHLKTGWIDIRPMLIAAERMTLLAELAVRSRVRDVLKAIDLQNECEAMSNSLKRVDCRAEVSRTSYYYAYLHQYINRDNGTSSALDPRSSFGGYKVNQRLELPDRYGLSELDLQSTKEVTAIIRDSGIRLKKVLDRAVKRRARTASKEI